ncbi:MAG: hypothetical protein MJ002_00305 [Paludibacteraceae bacterium]|nr:hypothetical protein [Paludibacteraceae bacterium]
MRKTLLAITLLTILIPLSAQRASRIHRNTHLPMDQAIRAKILGGYILPLTDFGKISHTPSVGVELSYEFFTDNKTDWPIHWRKPIIGIALQYNYLGNNDKMGQMFALYPYVRWDLTRSDFFIYSMRLGAGVAGMTKTNETNSSYFNFIGNYTMEFQINVTGFDWIMFDLGFNATNNCGLASLNNTMLQPYASFGYMHRFMPYRVLSTNESDHPYTKPLPYTFVMDLGVDAGAKDDWRVVKGGIHFDILGKVTNCWASGVGLDGEYEQRISGDTTNIDKRLRGGVSWANRFTVNRFHFILDWGIYIYDPEKPFEYLYKYDLRNGHAWNYFRIGAAVRLYDNLYLQLIVRTNGFRAEYTSFGLSYAIPIHRHNYYNKKKKRFMPYEIWHPDNDEMGFKATIHNYIHRPIR